MYQVCCVETSRTPWFERPFVHLDWSENYVDTQFVSAVGAVVASPFPLFANNRSDPNAPQFECGGPACGAFPDAGGAITRVRVTNRTVVAVAGGTADAGGADTNAIASEVTFRTEYSRER